MLIKQIQDPSSTGGLDAILAADGSLSTMDHAGQVRENYIFPLKGWLGSKHLNMVDSRDRWRNCFVIKDKLRKISAR